MNRYILLICVPLLLLASCTTITLPGRTSSGTIISWEKYQKELTDAERIALIRDRRKELDSIRKWDYFTLKNNPDEALSYYLTVAEKLPDDVVIQKKIGHAYSLKKDWKNAYAAYVRTPISELSPSEQAEMLMALFSDESVLDRIGELSRIPTATGTQDYYRIFDTCYTGIHNCIVSIEAYSGTSTQVKSLQSGILDAAKISPDYQYRNFTTAAKFYEYGAYRASAILSREILAARPDYEWVEKLLGFALYELGNTTDAKKNLLAYLEKYPKDAETILKLWEIAFAEHDYSTANLYYNNAIFAGYTPKTAIERKLAYSYSRLSDIPGMMRVLAYLIAEPDATEDDTAVAISLALQNGENLKAYVWASNALIRHKDSPMIVALSLTSMRLVGKKDDARAYLSTLSPSLLESPIVLLEKGILTLDAWDPQDALALFEQVRDTDPTADFSLEATNYIEEIQRDRETHTGSTDERAASWDIWWR
jgi:tetratricopeptide (TPR) repeat protein